MFALPIPLWLFDLPVDQLVVVHVMLAYLVGGVIWVFSVIAALQYAECHDKSDARQSFALFIVGAFCVVGGLYVIAPAVVVMFTYLVRTVVRTWLDALFSG